jgi:predicted DNA binding CopG/RHH family protein
MPNVSKTVKCRLKDPLYDWFAQEMASRNMTESELLRFAILHLKDSSAPQLAQVEPVAEKLTSDRTTIRMPEFLLEKVRAEALSKGMAVSKWVSALIQSNLMRAPVFTEAELMALEQTSRELNAIGRNINQIARVLNESYFRTESVRIDMLSNLSDTIAETRKAIGVLVRASRNVWRTD